MPAATASSGHPASRTVTWHRRAATAILAALAVIFVPQAQSQASSGSSNVLAELVREALERNPEIRASRSEARAAQHRVAPAAALDDPMLEAGLVNVPLNSLRLNREEMTMKMLGVSQRLPYPGKRALRRDVAEKEAEAAEYGYRETANRVVREVRVLYADLALVDRGIELVQQNRKLVEQLLRIAEGRYSVGQSNQADVLRAQTQLAKMTEELLRMERERRVMEADLSRALGRENRGGPIVTQMPPIDTEPPRLEAVRDAAVHERPQLRGLKALVQKNERALELARKDYNPDFDVRLQYGQRDRAPDGMPREDMVSLVVAINLPIWRQEKVEPRIAEANAMREQALAMYEAQRIEALAKLAQQVALAHQSRESVRLYDTGILPQARLTVESGLAAYRVNRVDFQSLLDSQMTVFGHELGQAQAVVAFHKALSEIDFLLGKPGAPQ